MANWNKMLLRSGRPYNGVVVRQRYGSHGWAWYALRNDEKGANFRKPLRHDGEGWRFL